MRFLLFYPLNIYRENLKEELRNRGANIIDIRLGKYLEIDVLDSKNIVINSLGKPLFEVEVGKDYNEKVWDLISQMRFWECHERLEEKWRNSNGFEKEYLQAVILVCASMIKYLKGEVEISDRLLEKALSLIANLPEEVFPLFFIRFILNS
jgi:hypothetical protein